ncbi:hypothetical protein E2C01_058827 [Portunus trituberculatus]|uniref:Uncharacterized protein n=1 Tax=Portunus trituberculatus TaxID=210409 RepID=A0A5B7H5S8_PORTR|nr:hypothetical protein [Portunus trituberculatus]
MKEEEKEEVLRMVVVSGSNNKELQRTWRGKGGKGRRREGSKRPLSCSGQMMGANDGDYPPSTTPKRYSKC